MHMTNQAADRLVRLPLWVGLEAEQDSVIDRALEVLEEMLQESARTRLESTSVGDRYELGTPARIHIRAESQ